MEDKRLASQQTIERLQREYEEMAVERRDNDRQVEELRAEADDIERKVRSRDPPFRSLGVLKVMLVRWLSI